MQLNSASVQSTLLHFRLKFTSFTHRPIDFLTVHFPNLLMSEILYLKTVATLCISGKARLITQGLLTPSHVLIPPDHAAMQRHSILSKHSLTHSSVVPRHHILWA